MKSTKFDDKSENAKRRSKRRRRNFQKGKDSKDFSDSREMVDKSTNDEKWYARNPQLLKDAASYPFSQPVGRRFPTNYRGTTQWRAIPGVCSLICRPSYGWGGSYDVGTGSWTPDPKNPINVAASELYSFVRHANSGAKNYEASDMMIYIASMANMYSYITWAMRIYALARMYDQYNRYMPQAIIEANSVNWGSIQDNLANYRYGLNVLINKVASLYVPATLPIFQRLAFLFQNVYAEGPSTKDQIYMYVPHVFQIFALDSNNAGCLIDYPQTSISITNKTWQDIINNGNAMFQAIWDEEDFATMSGDILKAFGGNVLRLNVMNEDYGIVPIYDEMVLTQMKNATVGFNTITTALYQISTTQYTSVLNPLAYADTSGTADSYNLLHPEEVFDSEQILTVPTVDPTPGVVIEASRMKNALREKYTLTATSNRYLLAPTSEVVTAVHITYLDAGTNTFQTTGYNGTAYIDLTNPMYNFTSIFVLLQMIKAFKYAPSWIIVFGSGDSNTVLSTCSEDTLFEVDNFTVLGSSEIMKLNEAALLSLYAVDSIGQNA